MEANWIAVTDQEPPKDEDVLCLTETRNTCIMCCWEDGNLAACVTHWMPLPELPAMTMPCKHCGTPVEIDLPSDCPGPHSVIAVTCSRCNTADKTTLLLGLPYSADESEDRDSRHWHIRNSSGYALLDVNTTLMPPQDAAMVRAFVVQACNSYHRRALLMEQAAEEMRYDASCVNADCETCADAANCIPRQIEAELTGGEL
jgi:hypothetical protein